MRAPTRRWQDGPPGTCWTRIPGFSSDCVCKQVVSVRQPLCTLVGVLFDDGEESPCFSRSFQAYQQTKIEPEVGCLQKELTVPVIRLVKHLRHRSDDGTA